MSARSAASKRTTGDAGSKRGTAWVLASFAACPCHLPLTLAAVTAVLGGTAAGALLRENIVLAGVLITAVWALGTWRGVWLIRQPAACSVPARRTTQGSETKVPVGTVRS